MVLEYQEIGYLHIARNHHSKWAYPFLPESFLRQQRRLDRVSRLPAKKGANDYVL